MDPEFINNLGSLFIMGGSQFAKGNVSRAAEFNFHSDPEAGKCTFGPNLNAEEVMFLCHSTRCIQCSSKSARSLRAFN
jgi:inosine-uridine nucleoside N-ribohydrolase